MAGLVWSCAASLPTDRLGRPADCCVRGGGGGAGPGWVGVVSGERSVPAVPQDLPWTRPPREGLGADGLGRIGATVAEKRSFVRLHGIIRGPARPRDPLCGMIPRDVGGPPSLPRGARGHSPGSDSPPRVARARPAGTHWGWGPCSRLGADGRPTWPPRQARRQVSRCVCPPPRPWPTSQRQRRPSLTGPEEDGHGKATAVPPPLWGVTR